MATKVTWTGTREELVEQAEKLAAMLAGTTQDDDNAGLMFLSSIGLAALADIKMAFLLKASGGTDDTGDTWPPLSPSTIAGRRVGPKDSAKAREWTKIRNRELKKIKGQFEKQQGELFDRFLLSLDPKLALKRAKTIAAHRASEHTGLTKLQALGARNVEILRDTGVLLNSISPGVLSDTGTYAKPGNDGGDQQVFELSAGQIILGTSVKYSSIHQTGTEHIPQRKIVPEDEADIPDAWWERWLDASMKSLEVAAADVFGKSES